MQNELKANVWELVKKCLHVRVHNNIIQFLLSVYAYNNTMICLSTSTIAVELKIKLNKFIESRLVAQVHY